MSQANYQIDCLQGEFVKEKNGLGGRISELISTNERLKLESNRQLTHFKTKYGEYKQKLRRANQNIATLLARVAKFDIQLTAEREDRGEGAAGQWGHGGSPDKPRKDGVFNHHELMAQDNLDEEIKKLLAD